MQLNIVLGTVTLSIGMDSSVTASPMLPAPPTPHPLFSRPNADYGRTQVFAYGVRNPGSTCTPGGFHRTPYEKPDGITYQKGGNFLQAGHCCLY
ncbi:hypothetical protein BDP81DRAFT_418941 [Colletotrichum phormii]|uniref:Uncharacterized protein n=1 Tax=Colletotrichum phormii TaxID=359342 RepID=A0AAJ0EJX4_9PEZI|nr:uncharacterized protein BDP81DRAFT_418941 [Colletotrichum phormii]KAK1641454.1 hypothetical protein BDP81DRAFT_418941 [Colletotrichum phormii]